MAEVGKSAEPKFTRAMVALIPFAAAFARRRGDVEQVLAKHRIPIGALSEPMIQRQTRFIQKLLDVIWALAPEKSAAPAE